MPKTPDILKVSVTRHPKPHHISVDQEFLGAHWTRSKSSRGTKSDASGSGPDHGGNSEFIIVKQCFSRNSVPSPEGAKEGARAPRTFQDLSGARGRMCKTFGLETRDQCPPMSPKVINLRPASEDSTTNRDRKDLKLGKNNGWSDMSFIGTRG